MENQKDPHLDIIDIINATKIMESAIDRGVFTVKELIDVAPVVSRFQDFSNAVQAEQTQKTEEPKEEQE